MARKKAKALPQPEPEMFTVYGDILQETEDAILVSCDGEEVWLPKSQIDYAGERGDEYALPAWLAAGLRPFRQPGLHAAAGQCRWLAC